MADGNDIADDGATVANGNASTQVDGEVVKAGVKYVTGDMTLQLGIIAGTAKDSDTVGTAGTTEDAYDKTSASISYAVASGVTAVIGFTLMLTLLMKVLLTTLQMARLGTLVLTWHFKPII